MRVTLGTMETRQSPNQLMQNSDELCLLAYDVMQSFAAVVMTQMTGSEVMMPQVMKTPVMTTKPMTVKKEVLMTMMTYAPLSLNVIPLAGDDKSRTNFEQ